MRSDGSDMYLEVEFETEVVEEDGEEVDEVEERAVVHGIRERSLQMTKERLAVIVGWLMSPFEEKVE